MREKGGCVRRGVCVSVSAETVMCDGGGGPVTLFPSNDKPPLFLYVLVLSFAFPFVLWRSLPCLAYALRTYGRQAEGGGENHGTPARHRSH